VKNISDDYNYGVDQIDFATPDNLRLDWKGRIKRWVSTQPGEELKFVSNGWDWDAYRSDGSEVYPE